VRHGTCFRRRLSAHHAGAAPHSAVAELEVVGFCVFGFLASYEYPDASSRLPWQFGYGLAGIVCLLFTVRLWRPSRSQRSPATSPNDNIRNA